MAALAVGGLVALVPPREVAIGRPVFFSSSSPGTVLRPLIAFGIGCPIGTWLGPIVLATWEPPAAGGDATEAEGRARRGGRAV